MNNIKKVAKAVFPNTQIKKQLWNLYTLFLIKYMPYRYKMLVNKIRKKKKIKVAFLIYTASAWKFDYLFRLFLSDEKFEPVIIICPVVNYDTKTMLREMDMAIEFFRKQNYPVISTWNEKSENWRDIKKEIKPDIVFFSNPWQEMSRPEYFIFNFLDTLTCYVPYSFRSSHLHQAHYNKLFQNLQWKIFYETEIHKKLAGKYALNKAINGVTSGYPGLDSLLDESYKPKDDWKIKDPKVKRIIWAPHHTIFGKSDSNLGFSTFLKYSDFMYKLAGEYQDKIQISLKPHPLLKPKLNQHSLWGKDRTEEYFRKWTELPNAQLNEGYYIDLFLTSDAMIHDSGSFMVEYLYTRKPVMFLIADDQIQDRFNEVGKMTFEQLYQGRNESDITHFIDDVVIRSNDYKKTERIQHFEKVVKPPKNHLASENIYNVITKAVC